MSRDGRGRAELPEWIVRYPSEKAFLDENRPGRGPSAMGPDDPGGADFGSHWNLSDESVSSATGNSATWRISWLIADGDESHEVYATNRSEVLLFGTLHPDGDRWMEQLQEPLDEVDRHQSNSLLAAAEVIHGLIERQRAVVKLREWLHEPALSVKAPREHVVGYVAGELATLRSTLAGLDAAACLELLLLAAKLGSLADVLDAMPPRREVPPK
jgi:hypothetical protein